MNELAPNKISCLCGVVTLTTKPIKQQFTACHCGMCRRWGGGPLLAVDCGTEVQFDGDEFVAIYNSSEWAERGFCKKCGTHLFYRLKESREYQIPVGLFEEVVTLKFGLQVFIDRKPDYYTFADITQKMSEEEIYEMYKPKS
ncbi:hypothetical protein Ga0123461_1038 [Mariprofundus aestuarium]|uniref:CENP-V/GFA domain-containing protein n=1 Tax=Mariprofundus aestuarium TaxID=1921086 RepID=A0A2K8KX31_MARES|nr:GFA family protein [Mariprofundus aestuarium]ATX79457.1 hypothetical protein Ga0123461_1038 [Mariprofundus aestuarium]